MSEDKFVHFNEIPSIVEWAKIETYWYSEVSRSFRVNEEKAFVNLAHVEMITEASIQKGEKFYTLTLNGACIYCRFYKLGE